MTAFSKHNCTVAQSPALLTDTSNTYLPVLYLLCVVAVDPGPRVECTVRVFVDCCVGPVSALLLLCVYLGIELPWCVASMEGSREGVGKSVGKSEGWVLLSSAVHLMESLPSR